MIAYEGKEPYVFVSYSHKDNDKVHAIIAALKARMCRTWYDEGLTPGESWNDSIAEHLRDSSEFLLFISPDSVKSKYVLSEVNYALSKDKHVIPVILRKTDMPVGLEMMLSSIQFFDVSDSDSVSEAVNMIASVLPKTVFSLTTMPFLEDLGHSFYMLTEDVERKDTGRIPAAKIVCKDKDGAEHEICSLYRTGAYDTSYHISSIDAIKDYFYPGKVIGSYQINIKGTYNLEYPLYGPDVDALLIFVLRIPRHGLPTMKLVDYQYVNSVASLGHESEENLDVVGEVGPSMQIKNYLDGILYK